VFDYIHPDDRDNMLNMLTESLEEGRPYDVEYRIIRPGGVERVVHAQGKMLEDKDGNKTKFIGTALDITERKMLEEKQQQLVTLVENSSDLIGIATLTGEITYVNSAGLRMIGLENLEAARRTRISDYITEEDRHGFGEILQEISRNGCWSGEFKLRNLMTGIAFPVELNGFLITNKQTGAPLAMATISSDITVRKWNENALRHSEARFRSLVETTSDWIWEIDENSIYTYASPKIRDLLGYEPEEVIGKTPFDLMHPEDAQRLTEEFKAIRAARKSFSGLENVNLHKDGNLVTIETSGVPIFDANGRFCGYRGIDRDVTERKKLEQKYLHAQKMEAVGQLAGGIAHDFNNILTAIIGYEHLLLGRIEDEKSRHYAEQVITLSEKAASLTRDLLTFSRKQTIYPKPLDLNNVIEKAGKLLKRLIGDDIEFRSILHEGSLPVTAVANQIEQVLMNLAMNARDAMPNGGSLTVRTDVTEIDSYFVRTHGYGEPGKYALLSVSDSGTGMDEQTRSRVFEPFFTTKEVGKGTGLGLATAYGIIKQHNGYINVYSEPGEGTTFRIYLPLVETGAGEEECTEEHIFQARGTETVLLAEDNQEVRETIKSLLEANGYRVIETVDGDDALEKYVAHESDIAVLISDVIMPKRNGKEVYNIISKARPDIKALFISGHTADILKWEGIPETCHMVTKPFSPHVFLKALRGVLDGADYTNGEPCSCT
jgi:PAS domain S-box-containing protein